MVETTVFEILLQKFRRRVPTLELYQRFPGYEREVALIAMSELPVENVERLLARERTALREVKRFRGIRARLGW